MKSTHPEFVKNQKSMDDLGLWRNESKKFPNCIAFSVEHDAWCDPFQSLHLAQEVCTEALNMLNSCSGNQQKLTCTDIFNTDIKTILVYGTKSLDKYIIQHAALYIPKEGTYSKLGANELVKHDLEDLMNIPALPGICNEFNRKIVDQKIDESPYQPLFEAFFQTLKSSLDKVPNIASVVHRVYKQQHKIYHDQREEYAKKYLALKEMNLKLVKAFKYIAESDISKYELFGSTTIKSIMTTTIDLAKKTEYNPWQYVLDHKITVNCTYLNELHAQSIYKLSMTLLKANINLDIFSQKCQKLLEGKEEEINKFCNDDFVSQYFTEDIHSAIKQLEDLQIPSIYDNVIALIQYE